MNFENYNFFVFCGNILEMVFIDKLDAINYIRKNQRYRADKYKLICSSDCDDSELQKLRESYEAYMDWLKEQYELDR